MSSDPTHSILSPSSAERWTDCTASVYLTHLFKQAKKAKTKKEKEQVSLLIDAFMPDQDTAEFITQAQRWREDNTSVFAEEGTRAHDMGERILKGTMQITDLEPEFECVGEYTSLCKTLHNRWGGEMFVESRVPLSYYPKEKGTVDCAIVGGDRICITDYKHGIGVMVDAEENLQLAAYALSFLKEYEAALDVTDETIVEIRIKQPRVRTGDTEKLWSTTVGHLKTFQALLEEKANLILGVINGGDPSALQFSPSEDNCRFCINKMQCPARSVKAFEPVFEIDVTEAFDSLAESPAAIIKFGPLLSPQQILNIHNNAGSIKKILADCEQYLLEQAVAGNPVPGTKLVQGRQGNRAWGDEAVVKERLLALLPEEDIVVSKLKSFNQVSTLLTEAAVPKDIIAEFDKLTVRSEGKPVLALESDKRPAITAASDAFDSIQNPENYAD